MKNNYLSTSFNSVHSLYIDPSWAGKSLDFSQMYFNQYKKVTHKTTKNIWSSPVHGKVRQLFEERRVCRGVGVDKSYPLHPLNLNKTASKSVNRLSDEKGGRSSSKDSSIQTNFLHRKLPNLGPSLKNSSGHKSMSNIPHAKSSFSKPVPTMKMSSITARMRQIAITTPRAESAGSSINRNPTMKPRSVITPETGRRTATPVLRRVTDEGTTKVNPLQVPNPLEVLRRRADSQRTTGLAMTRNESSALVKNQHGASKASTSTSKNMTDAMSPTKSANPEINRPKKSAPQSPHPNCSLPLCKICGRHFNVDRLEIHEKVCRKSMVKKRATFDVVQHRLSGTEAEQFYKKESFKKALSLARLKPNWRVKHEEFLANVRAARKLQDHLAKGGKLSDLPPPTPSVNPDYVSCPHCSRRFNEAAAERHIPRCANMRHNKPSNTGRIRSAVPQKK